MKMLKYCKKTGNKILYRFGPRSYISSNPGTCFTAHGVQQWAKRHHIRWIHHVAFHPQSSGLIGSWKGSSKRLFRGYVGLAPSQHEGGRECPYSVAPSFAGGGGGGDAVLNFPLPVQWFWDQGCHCRCWKQGSPLSKKL